MNIAPYLLFNGKCDEAIAFYGSALGATCSALMRFKDAPPGSGCNPAMADKVMHAELRIGSSTIMASDAMGEGECKFAGFSLTLNVDSATEAAAKFNALAASGKVVQPLQKTFFAESFGMVHDRFGVQWIVIYRP